MTEQALFDLEPTPAAEPEEKLSAGRRLTLRQKADVERGVHPLTRRRVHSDSDRSCGNCVFRSLLHGGARDYPKCTYGGPTMPRATHGATSDVRAWWPACTDHEWPADIEAER